MMMLDQCEDVITTQLEAHSVGLLRIAESSASETAPVPFRRNGSDLLCLLPRWTSLADTFEQENEQRVVLAVAKSRADGEYWLHFHGLAQETSADWSGFKPAGTKTANIRERYRLIQVTPRYLETTSPIPHRRDSTEHGMLATL